MRLVVRKDFAEEFYRQRKPKVYIAFERGPGLAKSFDSSLHPRDERGRFSDKGVMELTEAERQKLLDYLEDENYVSYGDFHVAEGKIDAVRKGLYQEEAAACEVLARHGFDVYLLDEKYVKGRKADTFFKKDGARNFMELKVTEDDVVRQYNRSSKQARNCFIYVRGLVAPRQIKNLKETVEKNASTDSVYLYISVENKFLKIK